MRRPFRWLGGALVLGLGLYVLLVRAGAHGARAMQPCGPHGHLVTIGGTLVVGVVFIAVDLLTDIIGRLADPRVRCGGEHE